MKRILAVAIGPERDMTISGSLAPGEVRPYIEGLIDGLAKYGHQAGQDYDIEYRERPSLDAKGGQLANTFSLNGAPPDCIFGMSTSVVRAANGAASKSPIVGVVSDRRAEGFGKAKRITGISARRSQTAGQCLEFFLATVPTIKRLFVLHKPKYKPSERSLKLVSKVAKKHGVAVKTIAIRSHLDVEKKLQTLPQRNPSKPADAGVLVLPVDTSIGAASTIAQIAQEQKKLPVFFSITDVVNSKASSPLGGHGVPQKLCGMLMADYVEKIVWQGADPAKLKVTEATDDMFEWVISKAAADSLNIKLPQLI
jgi:ABC-type uncharacterized transport system substrate-binding protein